MCIIVAKNKGINMPNNKILERCFTNNPDGAGIMYAENGAVHIRKGFMTYADFNSFLVSLGKKLDLTDIALVIHFRITTHGSTNPSTCHPFPISKRIKELKKTSLITNIGVAHNGIIPIKCIPKLSDTQTYIAKKLSVIHKIQPDFYNNGYIMRKIESDIHSKMCFLTADEEIYTIGKFIEKDGILYSNDSFEGYGRFSWLEWDYDSVLVCPVYGVIIGNGDIAESDGYEYFIDRKNKVYEYDYISSNLIPLDNAQAFTHQGMPYRFNIQDAIEISTNGGNMLW